MDSQKEKKKLLVNLLETSETIRNYATMLSGN